MSEDNNPDSMDLDGRIISSGTHGHILEQVVVFSNIEDQNSIKKIFQAANNCVQKCPSVHIAEWGVAAILSTTLKMEDELLTTQERVCVFLSLLLHHFSVVSSGKIGIPMTVECLACFDSFLEHMYSDWNGYTEAGSILSVPDRGFSPSEFSEALLVLLQDLLSKEKVLVSVTVDGENITVVRKIVSTDELVAGAAILAGFCSEMDWVGVLCKFSFAMLLKQRRCHEEETPEQLTILHIFGHIAAHQMVFPSEHDIQTRTLISVVLFLEDTQFVNLDCNSLFHAGKNKCPFSSRYQKLEDMASELIQMLREFTQSNASPIDSSYLDTSEYIPAPKDFQCELIQDHSVNLFDIMSYLELIAFYKAWDWTNENIVAPLLEMLELLLPMHLSVAIVTTLGKLSSIGVGSVGYKNKSISNLRVKLSEFLRCGRIVRAGFHVRTRVVSSLLKTMPLKFPTDIQGITIILPAPVDQSFFDSVNLVTKWLSQLSDEERVLAIEFFQNF